MDNDAVSKMHSEMSSKSILPTSKTLLIQDAKCCFQYPVIAFMPLGHCGRCGERPTILGNPRQIYVPLHPLYLSPYFLGTFYGSQN